MLGRVETLRVDVRAVRIALPNLHRRTAHRFAARPEHASAQVSDVTDRGRDCIVHDDEIIVRVERQMVGIKWPLGLLRCERQHLGKCAVRPESRRRQRETLQQPATAEWDEKRTGKNGFAGGLHARNLRRNARVSRANLPASHRRATTPLAREIPEPVRHFESGGTSRAKGPEQASPGCRMEKKDKALKGRHHRCVVSRPFRALSEKNIFPRAALVPRLPWAGLPRAFGPKTPAPKMPCWL